MSAPEVAPTNPTASPAEEVKPAETTAPAATEASKAEEAAPAPVSCLIVFLSQILTRHERKLRRRTRPRKPQLPLRKLPLLLRVRLHLLLLRRPPRKRPSPYVLIRC
jgi:hypothetical protein